jgi:heptosyltransferase-2
MHLAWIQHVPVVALFGPTVRSLGFFPRGESVVLEVPPADADEPGSSRTQGGAGDTAPRPERDALACRPCGLHGLKVCPRGDHACMTGISPERVWAAVRARLFPGG